jgi:hypothetical protein
LEPANINLCRNPAIACQYNNIDNDSSNMTEIVLFDRYNANSNSDNVKGYYNLQAVNHSYFRKVEIGDSNHFNLQPSITYNRYDTTFMITYFDQTSLKLPLISNNFNLKNPNQWQTLSTGYNDSSNLSSPFPKIIINDPMENAAQVWVMGENGVNGVGMFDAQYSTYTGFNSSSQMSNTPLNIFPNPCSTYITVEFELAETEIVRLSIYNLTGKLISTLVDQSFSSGKHTMRLNVSNLTPNCYLYKFESDNKAVFGKLVVRP